METINRQPLYTRDELRKLLRKYCLSTKRGRDFKRFTHVDIARFVGTTRFRLHYYMTGREHISNEFQLRLSQMLRMIESGELVTVKVGSKKVIARVVPEKRVRPLPQPYVDFSEARLRFL